MTQQRKRLLSLCLYVFVVSVLLAPILARADIAAPNDPLYGEQYALQVVGAPCAWTHTTGSADVIVAVIDSGVDLDHPDLVGRLRDDGYDFVDDDAEPRDENGHGTNVAGVIAMTLDNGEGGVGLAPDVSILPVRVMDRVGYGADQAIASGVRYAAERGARVINISLGATLTIGAQNPSAPVISAISYAQERGALVIVAAGNDFVPLPNAIIGENTDVLVVAATDANDKKAAFSNSGPWISVTAPGVHILSTMPTYPVYLTGDDLPPDERFKPGYDYMSGTSQATPFVSALAALLFSANPTWDATQVATTIRERAADISLQNVELAQRGYLGSGRISACDAFGGPNDGQAAVPVPAPAPQTSGQPAPVPQVSTQSREQGGSSSMAPITVSGDRGRSVLIPGALCVLLLGLLGGTLLVVRRSRTLERQSVEPLQHVLDPPAVPTPSSARPDEAWGALVVLGGPGAGQRFPLRYAESIIGRSVECDVALTGDATVSRRHALVRNDGDAVTIEDLGSTHGTTLRGVRVRTPVMVRRGDVVQIGQTLVRFE